MKFLCSSNDGSQYWSLLDVRQDLLSSTRSPGSVFSLNFSVSRPNQSSNAVVVLELHPLVAGLPLDRGDGLGTVVPVGHLLVVPRHQARAGAGGLVFTLLAVELTDGVLAVDLHVFPERGGMSVGLVTPPDLAVVRLVAGVDVRVLLSITGVGEPSVAPVKFTFEGFLTWNKKECL